ncbi:hypothetical protein [Neptuniibacter sp. QD37_11]|uniref:hypothetical protein n=1 Tax=Neptuniibacter sp. QD37_11 TaxID=3398209 RepID=UPI0039F4B101
MSVLLLDPSTVDSVVKTMIGFYDDNFGSKDEIGNRLASLIYEVFTSVSDEFGVMDMDAMDSELMDRICRENIEAFQENCQGRYSEEAFDAVNTLDSYQSHAKPLDANGPVSLISLQKTINHIASQLSRDTELGKALDKVDDYMPEFVFRQLPAYPDSVSPMDQIASDLVSLNTHGDQLYHSWGPIKTLLNAFEITHRPTKSIVWGDRYFASLFGQVMAEDRPIVIPSEWNHVPDEQLPTLTELAGEKLPPIGIQADVPPADMSQMFRVAKALEVFRSKVEDMDVDDVIATNGEPFSQEELDELKGKVESAVSGHYKKAFNGVMYHYEKMEKVVKRSLNKDQLCESGSLDR